MLPDLYENWRVTGLICSVPTNCQPTNIEMKKILVGLILFKFANGLFKGHKYMPMGYEKKPDCPKVPSKKPGGNFDVWMFLASIALSTNIAANLANK